MSKVVIITGPCGCGKSTITKRLAEISKLGAVINVDEIRDMIKGGYKEPWLKDNKTKEQLQLAAKNACALANNFIDSGVDVFIDDVILDKEYMALYKKLIKKEFKTFLLLPSMEVLIKRDSSRESTMGARAIELHDQFSYIKDKFDWQVIDSSLLSVNETIKLILKKI